MIYKLEKTVHDNEAETFFRKTLGLNSPEPYVFTHKRFNTCIVLVFSDIKKPRFTKCHIEIVHIMKLKYV